MFLKKKKKKRDFFPLNIFGKQLYSFIENTSLKMTHFLKNITTKTNRA